jgi:hypothetical protein
MSLRLVPFSGRPRRFVLAGTLSGLWTRQAVDTVFRATRLRDRTRQAHRDAAAGPDTIREENLAAHRRSHLRSSSRGMSITNAPGSWLPRSPRTPQRAGPKVVTRSVIALLSSVADLCDSLRCDTAPSSPNICVCRALAPCPRLSNRRAVCGHVIPDKSAGSTTDKSACLTGACR